MKIYEKIMQHLDLFTALTGATKALLVSAQKQRVDLVAEITDNRDRLINVIKTVQTSIEDDIAALNPARVTREQVDIIKTWGKEINQIVLMNDKLDKECMLLLEQQKEDTTKEIATVFTNHQAFKGYDLSNVKK